MSPSKILLSTTSVYPEASTSAFELAASLGYDGVELMIGVDALSTDIEAIAKLSEYHSVAVPSVHAPTLLLTQTTWGGDPWDRLRRSGEAAQRLGADTVVVHPPFRWQRDYGAGFVEGIRALNREFNATFAVENMFPWRTPAGNIPAYLPGWDPTGYDYDHLTLDLSHAATSQRQSLDLIEAWGDRLAHVHFTDGRGSLKDEHLLPGEGNQQVWRVLGELVRRNYHGHIVLEVSTRRARSRHEREALLRRCLEDIRACLRGEAVTR